jgi:hypothetical protein
LNFDKSTYLSRILINRPCISNSDESILVITKLDKLLRFRMSENIIIALIYTVRLIFSILSK